MAGFPPTSSSHACGVGPSLSPLKGGEGKWRCTNSLSAPRGGEGWGEVGDAGMPGAM